MALSRDKIMSALRNRLKERVPDLAYCERKFLTWEEATQQPALCVVMERDRPIVQGGLPTRHEISVLLFLYNRERPDQPETPQLRLIDAIEKALERTPEESLTNNVSGGAFTTTFNGLVQSCDLGEIELYQGDKGAQAVAVIRIEILAIHSP